MHSAHSQQDPCGREHNPAMTTSARSAWIIAVGSFFAAVALAIGAVVVSSIWVNANEPTFASQPAI